MRARTIGAVALVCFAAGTGRAAQSPEAVGPLPEVHRMEPGGPAGTAICDFCHTPAGSPGDAPRWAASARAPAAGANDSGSADGGIVVSGAVSVMCLSCHDGAQAAEAYAASPLRAPMRGLSGLETRGHPVGIPLAGDYNPGAGLAALAPRLQREVADGRVRWWLDLEGVPNGRRDRSDAILFVRGEDPAAQPFVECATCHDPHGRPEAMLLRNPEAGSRLCLACHDR